MHTTADRTAPTFLIAGVLTPVTTFLLVHHGLRRYVSRIRDVLARPDAVPDAAALRQHWSLVHLILKAHHQAEDTVLFPALRAAHPELGIVIDALDAEHGLLDDLLTAVDVAIADAGLDADRTAALAAVDALARMLHAHLTSEEAHLVPAMRDLPPGGGPQGGGLPPTTTIPWSMDGVHPDVVAALLAGLPAAVAVQALGWLDDCAAQRTRTFGPALVAGTATTAVPEAHRDAPAA